MGSFRIVSDAIDGVTDTDGIEVTSINFNHGMDEGFFIAQDGQNDNENQNFKVVDWKKIKNALNLK